MHKLLCLRCKTSSFLSKLLSLEFHHCSTCLKWFPDLTMAAGSTECRHCTQDKHIPKLYSTANNMNPRVVPRQLQVHKQVTHTQTFCFFVPTVGTITSGGDDCLCYHADNVDLPTTSWPVWLHRTHHQSSSKCNFICSQSSKAAFRPRCSRCEEREWSISLWLPSLTCCCTTSSWVVAGKQQVLPANQMHLNEDAFWQLPDDGDITELTSLQLKESTPDNLSQQPQEDVRIRSQSFKLILWLMLCSSRQSKRLFVSPSKNDRVDQLALSCGPLLEELLSTNSPPRDISPWPSPPYF